MSVTTTAPHITVDVDRSTWGEREYRMALTIWAEPGDSTLGSWIQRLADAGHPHPVQDVISAIESGDGGLGDEERAIAARVRPRLSGSDVASAFRWFNTHVDVAFLIPGDAQWPTPLDDLGAARPYGIWARGNVDALTAPQILTISGARASTSYGDHVALEIASDLAAQGVVIATGAAYGIDGAASRAALTVDGIAIAVLAGGIDRHYPAGHSQLIERVATSRGAVISEVAPGGAPTKWRFLQRGRILAALSGAVVIVEAGWRSGSLNTAGHAAALGRGVGAVPGPITSACSAGTHRLIREQGAAVITSAQDALDLI